MLLRPVPARDSIVGGRYRVVRELGRGGMGVVLEAENTVTLKRVAIKCLHPLSAGRADASARLVREARAAARVRHPNVVDIYDVVEENELVFLVMELLEGAPLSSLIEGKGAPIQQVLRYLIDAMRGVAAAHSRGIVHRDMKPDNIFLAQLPDDLGRQVKVLDFGISKLLEPDRASAKTSGIVGTPMYMSMEQICSVRDIDARTDVYAFGVMLYELATGHTPYVAENFPQLAVKILQESPKPPRELAPGLSRTFERVIMHAMAKDRDERTPNLKVLISELESLLEVGIETVDPLGRTLPQLSSSQTSAAALDAAFKRTRVLVASALACALVGLVAWLVWRANVVTVALPSPSPLVKPRAVAAPASDTAEQFMHEPAPPLSAAGPAQPPSPEPEPLNQETTPLTPAGEALLVAPPKPSSVAKRRIHHAVDRAAPRSESVREGPRLRAGQPQRDQF